MTRGILMPSLAEMGPFYFHFEFMRAVQFAENARIALAITLCNKRRAISEPYVVADKLRARDTGGQISPSISAKMPSRLWDVAVPDRGSK